MRVKLQGQPIRLLEVLLEKPGQLVNREEIRQKIWGTDTFVDFDHNLNTAVKKLRQALGDGAETPRYIETLPKYGYRFIGEVDKEPAQDTAVATNGADSPGFEGRPRKQKRAVYFVAITAGIVSAIVFAAWYSHRTETAPRVPVRSQLISPHPLGKGLALSPDAHYLVYPSGEPGQLWLKDLREDTEEPLPGTESAGRPFWAPDGRSVGFFADGNLKKIALDSRIVTTICAQDLVFSTWGKSGVILMSTPRGVQSVSSDGGPKRDIYPPGVEYVDTRPSFLPDGNHFLFMRVPANRYFSRGESGTLYIGSLDGSPPRSLGLRVTGRASYAAGYLLYPTQHGLFAQAFDVSKGHLSGEPTLLVKSGGLDVVFDASDNGVLVFSLILSYQAGDSEIRLYSRDGKEQKDPIVQGFVDEGRFSPDGTRIAYAQTIGDNRDIWIYDLARRVNFRLTPGDSSYSDPVWSPDSKRVAYSYFGSRTRGTAIRNADGTGNSEVVLETPNENPLGYWVRSWGAGDCLFLTVTEITGPRKIQVLCLTGDRRSRPIADPESTSRFAQVISPDGKWLAYTSSETGRFEIFVEPYPGPGKSVRVSVDGGNFASWRNDGRELFFLSRNSVVSAVSVSYAQGEIKVSKPNDLFSFTQRTIYGGIPFSASPDGKWFAINTSLVQPSDTVNLITNWDAPLKK